MVDTPEIRDEVLSRLMQQRSAFEQEYKKRYKYLIEAVTVSGTNFYPDDDPMIKDFQQRGVARLEEYERAYKDRLTCVEEFEAEFSDVTPDVIPPPEEDANEMKTVNQFLVGADPEFGAYKKGKVFTRLQDYISHQGLPFGYDHGGRVIELKPNPAKSSYRVIRNIRNLLLNDPTSLKMIKDGVRYRGGAKLRHGGTDDLGGHIHIGLPYCEEQNYVDGKAGRVPFALTAEMKLVTEVLDRYTGVLESLDILPQKESRLRRTNGAYGKFGDMRIANNDNHCEYRTMCSWMHSPVAALIALTGVKLCASHPYDSYRLMGPVETASMPKLLRFFEAYKSADIDAARVVEKILEKGVDTKAEPDADMLKSWKTVVPELA